MPSLENRSNMIIIIITIIIFFIIIIIIIIIIIYYFTIEKELKVCTKYTVLRI